jgi:hypothetical protein
MLTLLASLVELVSAVGLDDSSTVVELTGSSVVLVTSSVEVELGASSVELAASSLELEGSTTPEVDVAIGAALDEASPEQVPKQLQAPATATLHEQAALQYQLESAPEHGML